MLKTAGIFLILTASAGIGFGKSRELVLRERALGHILLMIRWLKGEICSQHASLPNAFLGVSQRMPDQYREFLTKLSKEMRESHGVRFGELFQNCAMETLNELPLSKKEWELFLSLGGCLGYLDLEMQRRQLEFYEEEFARFLNDLRMEAPARKKVYQSLGVMGGILLAILVC